MDRRLRTKAKSSDLPQDYLKMVGEVFTANFDAGLKAIEKLQSAPANFEIRGHVFPDELVVSVSLVVKDQLAATTVYASLDFDPKASAPNLQDLLPAAIDGIAMVFSEVMDPAKPERLEKLAEGTLSALDNVPFHWSEAKVDRFRVHLKLDKSNPVLDEMADQFLDEKDPRTQAEKDEEERQTEALFVTGPGGHPTSPHKSSPPGSKKKKSIH